MERSILIAKIFGPCFFLVGISMLMNRDFLLKMMDDFKNNAAMILFSGMASMVTGIVMVYYHNVWTYDWRILITFIAWAGVLKGVWLILFPKSIERFFTAYKKNQSFMKIHSLLAIALGAFLSVFGYFVG